MNKKKIKILTKGPIRVKGFINGPVLTPYYEDLNTIFSMIVAGIHVVEVLEDGTEVKLTTTNLSEINIPEKPVEDETKPEPEKNTNTNVEPEDNKEEIIKVVEPEVENTDINADDTVIVGEETTEEIKEVEYKREPDFNRMNKHNKKNHKKN